MEGTAQHTHFVSAGCSERRRALDESTATLHQIVHNHAVPAFALAFFDLDNALSAVTNFVANHQRKGFEFGAEPLLSAFVWKAAVSHTKLHATQPHAFNATSHTQTTKQRASHSKQYIETFFRSGERLILRTNRCTQLLSRTNTSSRK